MNRTLYKMPYMQKLEALASAVRQRMEELNLNTYQVAERATQKGHKIVHGTVWNIINRNVNEVKDRTLTAIAVALNMPIESLRAIVRGEPEDLKKITDRRFAQLADNYHSLSVVQKEILEPFLSAVEQGVEKFHKITSLPDKQKMIPGPPEMTPEEFERRRAEKDKKNKK